MSKIIIVLGDVKDRLSVAYAKAQGYEFTLHSDGNAEVADNAGTVYHVQGFVCNCLDKLVNRGSHNGRCAHEIWVAQLFLCTNCEGTMTLSGFFTPLGGKIERFECPTCGNAREFELVRVERGMRCSAAMKESLQHG